VTLTGTARGIAGSDNETGTVVLKALATGEARADFTYPSGLRSEVQANSSQGPVGSWSNPDGTSGAIPLHNLLVNSGWFSPTLMLSELSSSDDVLVSNVGTDTRGGLAVHHLRISKQFPSLPSRVSADLQRLSQVEVYLDASTSLPVSISFNTHPDNDAGRDIPVEMTFSDYRIVSAVQIPFHVQKYFNGSLILDLQLSNAELNAGLSPNLFSVPQTASVPANQDPKGTISFGNR
jgi:hypothetical protein